LTSALVLKILDPNGNFLVVTDASREGLGGVLLQDMHVVAFESMKLRVHEVNYAPHDLELAAIVDVLQ
ncbi:hypothetical protein KI387_036286, partial [Taxus chinensis]